MSSIEVGCARILLHKQVGQDVLQQEELHVAGKPELDERNRAALRFLRPGPEGSKSSFLFETAEENSPENLARFDRTRLDKSCSNQEWENPHDPEAQVARMMDGSRPLVYKAEHAMDLETDALLSPLIHPANKGDTETVSDTVAAAAKNVDAVQEHGEQAQDQVLEEPATGKGYYNSAVLVGLKELGVHSCISEPERGRRRWRGKEGIRAHPAVYANRRRIRRAKERLLQRLREEIRQRSFAHMLETGGMRRGSETGRMSGNAIWFIPVRLTLVC